MNETNTARIKAIKTEFATPWFSIEGVDSELSPGGPYYRLTCPDSVTVLALTTDRKIILVRQYRLAIESWSLELPAGYVDDKEKIDTAMRREMLEETGFSCGQLHALGPINIVPSRVHNTVYTYVATDCHREPTQTPELEIVLVDEPEFQAMIRDGRYNESAGIAVYYMAKLKGFI